jgi:uncharacterized protein YaiL (DUF2058 family)
MSADFINIDDDDDDDDDPILEGDPILEDDQENWTKAEKAKYNKEVRKRIDELLEKKRLKELLGDDDWDF